MPRDELEEVFPGLRTSPYSVESPQTRRYNCVAWALGFNDAWWWPDEESYWPSGIDLPQPETIVPVFQTHGYAPCDVGDLEPGFEKVALYTSNIGLVSHVARQLPSGQWTSKCGDMEDIIHVLEGLEGPRPAYGRVAQFLRRLLIADHMDDRT